MEDNTNNLSALIEALSILLKYGNPDYPTCCEHDVMFVWGISPESVSPEDIQRLDVLGFFIGTDSGEETFQSHRFGSA